MSPKPLLTDTGVSPVFLGLDGVRAIVDEPMAGAWPAPLFGVDAGNRDDWKGLVEVLSLPPRYQPPAVCAAPMRLFAIEDVELGLPEVGVYGRLSGWYDVAAVCADCMRLLAVDAVGLVRPALVS